MDFKTNKKTKKPFPSLRGWSSLITFKKENISKVPDATGVYLFFNKNRTPIYIGRSKNKEFSGLRHRIQSYNEVDDYNEHKTKRVLRGKIASFRYKTTTVDEARKLEMTMKQHLRYNADNEMNEARKHGSSN